MQEFIKRKIIKLRGDMGKVGYENVEDGNVGDETKLKDARVENKKISSPPVSKKISSPVQLKKESVSNNQNKISEPMKKIPYRFAGRETLIEFLKKVMPKEFYPTKRLEMIFGIIFIVVIILSLIVNFSVSDLIRGEEIGAIEVGLPFSFLVFDLNNVEKFPLRIIALIVDMIIYLFIAYIIDVMINFIHYRAKTLTKEERGKKPQVLKVNQKKTLADKITKKLFDE